MHSFTTSDGVRLNYYIDDFTDPWTKPPTLLLLHPAMGTAKRYYAMVPKFARQYPDGAPRFARSWKFADSG